MIVTQQKHKVKLSLSIEKVVFILIALLISFKSALAVESTNPSTEIMLVVTQDGTEPFDYFTFPPLLAIEDALVDGMGGHTPGLDAHNVGNTITPGLNGVVRTFDSVLYDVHWNVNDVDSSTSNDGADGIATNVVITLSTRREDVSWANMPFRCKTSGVTPLSSIVDNGVAGDLLTCNLGDIAEGTAGTISLVADVVLTADGSPSDGGLIPITATIVTEQSPLVTSNEVTTTISAAPAGDWVKSGAEVIYNIPNSAMVDGAVLIYPISFIATGPSPIFAALPAPDRGSEPLNDMVAMQFFDHAWDLTPNATFATPAMELLINRKICGGYDGNGELPYGDDGALPVGVNVDGIDNETNPFILSCSDETVSAGLGYPVIQIDISGQDTTSTPAKNTNSNPNVSNLVITLQVAFWVPTTELTTKFNEPLDPDKLLWNTITANNTLDTSDLNMPFPGVVTNTDPIQLGASSGLIDEVTINNNSVNQTVNPVFTPPPAGTSYVYRHSGRFYPGPYQELFFPHPDGLERMGIDTRPVNLGGLGPIINGDIATDYGWHGTGEVSRNQIVTLHAKVTGSSDATVPYDEPIHLCTVIDNNHVEIIDFTSDFLRFETDRPLFLGDTTFPSVSSNTGNATDGIAHVLIGDSTSNIGSKAMIEPDSNPWVRLNPLTTPSYVVQVTNLNALDDFTIPYNVGQNGLGCDTSDAGPLGWVNTNGDLSAFITGTDVDGNNVYGNISKIRVLMLTPQSWQDNLSTTANTSGTESSNIVLNMQARVKPQLLDAPDDSLIRIHTSRGRGVIADETNFTLASANCTNDGVFDPVAPLDIALTDGGWCNLAYNTSAEAAGAATQQIDTSAIEALFSGDPDTIRTAHSDRIVVIDATLGITKTNISGPNDLVTNGDLVTFRVEANIIGSPVEHFSNVYVEDRLDMIANFEFVSQTAPVDANGMPVTGIVNCVDNFGGTQDSVRCDFTSGAYNSTDPNTYRASPFYATWDITVRLTAAPGNSAIENVAVINGTLVESGVPITVKSKLRNSYAYTGPSHNEISIRKDVPDLDGVCSNGAGAIELADNTLLAGDCSVFEVNGQYQYDFTYTNTGSADLTNVVIIDVFPHTADTTEPIAGDGRTPASAFNGTSQFVSIVAVGAVIECTADPVATINRDDSIDASTWTGTCDTASTGFRVTMPTLNISESNTIQLVMQTNGNGHNDIYTNTFGARAGEILLATRSNDVSAMVVARDWGDAPDTAIGNGTGNYSTQANDNGPSHLISSTLLLGVCVDDETDGQQSLNADGDDTGAAGSITEGACASVNDDEDSLIPPQLTNNQLAPTFNATVSNTTGADATLACWIDYNNDGIFDNATERTGSVTVANGDTTASIVLPDVPATASTDTGGTTYMRCRIASIASEVNNSTGSASNGEVEDYLVNITLPRDWGDAPDTAVGNTTGNYSTLATDNGPNHLLDTDLYMGVCVDDDAGTIQSIGADSDDSTAALTLTNGVCTANDDEDSLTPPTLQDGEIAPTIAVTVVNTTAADATIACWIDYNADGVFDNATERGSALTNVSGTVNVSMPNVPATANADTGGSTYMRCRVASDATQVADATGAALTGEVEDYPMSINPLFSLGDYVWYDNNQNGLQDAGELGVNGITVTLFNDANCTAGNEVGAPTMTANGGSPAADGWYEFSPLPSGTYCVAFTGLPVGWVITSQNQGGDDTQDSDVDIATAQIQNINLTANDPNEDMGIYAAIGTVPGNVFCDVLPFNGTNDGTEGQANITVNLLRDNNCDGTGDILFATMDTDINGDFNFTNVPVGLSPIPPNPQACYVLGYDLADIDLAGCSSPFLPETGVVELTTDIPDAPETQFGNIVGVPIMIPVNRLWALLLLSILILFLGNKKNSLH